MKISMIKNGKIQYTFNTEDADIYSNDSPLFQDLERFFDEWLKDSNPASEYQEQYFGMDAIYDVAGAIEEAIEALIEYCEVKNKTRITKHSFDLADLAACFE
jgi:tetratricopeptide (TPR) repeat protein